MSTQNIHTTSQVLLFIFIFRDQDLGAWTFLEMLRNHKSCWALLGILEIKALYIKRYLILGTSFQASKPNALEKHYKTKRTSKRGFMWMQAAGYADY